MNCWRDLRMKLATHNLALGVILSWCGSAPGVDFENDVLPIFEHHCTGCHGPEKQKSDFRLDLREVALKAGHQGPAIVPGKPQESNILRFVGLDQDDEMRMPPKGAGLSREEIATLERWIADGAAWPDELAGEDERMLHWSWQPLSVFGDRYSVNRHQYENPIDRFIEKKLDSIGYRPGPDSNESRLLSPRADRGTLIRRLSFDLHGLPPSPEEVERFVTDPDPDAYGKLVDRMLASPHYGERFARHWLDIAHYADTHGFERDKRRDTAWRYRDYVIASFNRDKPYNRFLREQIAGDVLYPEDETATIATGFLAAGPWDFVGQVETKSPVLRRSARALDLDDMVTQVMTSTVGMTVNCARCHDHKLDPISQEEYFRLTAVFAGVKRDERVINEEKLKAFEEARARLVAERDAVSHRIANLEGQGLDLADIVGGGNGLGTGTRDNGIDPRSARIQTRKFGDLGNIRLNRFARSAFPFVDGVFVADGENGEAEIPVSSTGITVTGVPTTSGKAWDHIRNGPVASQHSTELDGIDFAGPGHTLLGIHANAGITFDLEAMRKASGHADLRFTSQVGYFGAAGAHRADVRIFLDGEMVFSFAGLRREDGLQAIDIPLPETSRFLTLLATDGENGYGHDQVGFGDARIVEAVPGDATPEQIRELSGLRNSARQLDFRISQLGEPPRFYGVVAEEEVPEVRIQHRGDPESEKGEPLAPGALSLLAPLESDLADLDSTEGERRAALAEWITHPDNPLTPRVIVNRLWHWHFGRGLVDTPSDFGLGGDRPSHPELLDWLAGELIRADWSLKAIHRLILTSETYQQQSYHASDSPGMALDAENRYLWRQNPRRIEAESVRDAVLAVSGKLNRQAGGPGFEDFTYTEAYAPIYEYITADEPRLWRRSIYRYVVRTTPDRFLTTLDCPDPANLTPKRFVTTTPLQSLALYNNDFMLRQARYFAERIEEEAAPGPGEQIALAFRYALGRLPSGEEISLAREFVETNGLFAFCRSLFNTNEFVYVD